MHPFVPSFAIRARARNALVSLALGGAALAHAAAGVEVPVVKASPQAVTVGIELDGVVEPVKQSTVAAQASGRISQLAVKAGDHVRAGQLLATIDDRESQTGVQRSRAQTAQAEAELRNAQAQLQRTRELTSKGFVSKAALDTAEAAFKGAEAARDQASAGQRQSAIAQEFTRVAAPYEGWVLETLAQAGDLAVPGKPLLTLYAPLPLRAVVQVPASRAAAARAAATVEVRIPDGDGIGRWISPAARAMLPAADPVAQTLEWRLELPAAAARTVAPGQQVHVRFAAGPQRRVVVPASAVLRRGELTAVYVVSPNGAGFLLKAVRLGADHGTPGVEVLAGLDAADWLALDPVKASLAGARPIIAP
ncbi:MAG TPA: efflux RND transporter periplasmic adaptor subunit [Ramlibacter sp.]|nr:efflux RND transporter periplasmic adaptor subunit [Ramlibacter sp.]